MKHRSAQKADRGGCALSAKSAVLIAAAIGLLIPVTSSIAAGDEANDAEIRRLQGRYERTFKNDAGTEFRVVKEVVGDQSTVTTYDDVGNVLEAHTSTFKTEKRGEVRVWLFFNVHMTAGPAKGRQQLETRSYIYRADDNNFAEVSGFLESDPSPPRMFIWKRVK